MHFAISKCRDVCEHILLWSYQADTNRLSSFWHGFYSPYLFSAHIQHTLMPLLITWTDSSTSSITLTLREILHWCNHISHCPLSRCFQSKHTRLQSPRERERDHRKTWEYLLTVSCGGHSADSWDITHMRCMVTGSGGQGEEQTNTWYPRSVTADHLSISGPVSTCS